MLSVLNAATEKWKLNLKFPNISKEDIQRINKKLNSLDFKYKFPESFLKKEIPYMTTPKHMVRKKDKKSKDKDKDKDKEIETTKNNLNNKVLEADKKLNSDINPVEKYYLDQDIKNARREYDSNLMTKMFESMMKRDTNPLEGLAKANNILNDLKPKSKEEEEEEKEKEWKNRYEEKLDQSIDKYNRLMDEAHKALIENNPNNRNRSLDIQQDPFSYGQTPLNYNKPSYVPSLTPQQPSTSLYSESEPISKKKIYNVQIRSHTTNSFPNSDGDDISVDISILNSNDLDYIKSVLNQIELEIGTRPLRL